MESGNAEDRQQRLRSEAAEREQREAALADIGGQATTPALEKARKLTVAGQYKAAIKAMWTAESMARHDPEKARAVLAVATQIRDHATGGAKKDADRLVELAQSDVESSLAEVERRAAAELEEAAAGASPRPGSAREQRREEKKAEFRARVEARRLGLTPEEMSAKLTDGGLSWWESPDGLKSLGLGRRLALTHASYYGGWPGHQTPEGKPNLVLTVDVRGISLGKLVTTIFTIPWPEIQDITLEGPLEAASRFTATRLIALGPLGLAFKKAKKGSKETILTVTTKGGDEAIFHIATKLPREIAPKLTPVAMQARRASKGDDESDAVRGSSTPAAPTLDIPAQLEKLAELKDKGILTDEEFAAKKTELLERM